MACAIGNNSVYNNNIGSPHNACFSHMSDGEIIILIYL